MSLTHLIRQSKNDQRKWLQLKRKAVDLEFETYKESFCSKMCIIFSLCQKLAKSLITTIASKLM